MLKTGWLVSALLRGAIKNDEFDFIADVVGALVDEVPEMVRDLRDADELTKVERNKLISDVVLEAVDDVFDEVPYWGAIPEERRDALLEAVRKLVAVTAAPVENPDDKLDGPQFLLVWEGFISPAIGEIGAFIADAIANKPAVANPSARKRRRELRFGRTHETPQLSQADLDRLDLAKITRIPKNRARLQQRVERAVAGAGVRRRGGDA